MLFCELFVISCVSLWASFFAHVFVGSFVFFFVGSIISSFVSSIEGQCCVSLCYFVNYL